MGIEAYLSQGYFERLQMPVIMSWKYSVQLFLINIEALVSMNSNVFSNIVGKCQVQSLFYCKITFLSVFSEF